VEGDPALHLGLAPGPGAVLVVVTPGHARGLRARASLGAKAAPSPGRSPVHVPSLAIRGTSPNPAHLGSPRRNPNPNLSRDQGLVLAPGPGTRAGPGATARIGGIPEAVPSLLTRTVTGPQMPMERMMIGIK